MPPPAAALDRAAPPYALWSTVPGLEADDRLAFMRNQHLAFNCECGFEHARWYTRVHPDEHCRRFALQQNCRGLLLLSQSCRSHLSGGATHVSRLPFARKWKLLSSERSGWYRRGLAFQALNFTLSNLFHLGVVATDEDWSFPDPGQPKPFEHSRRLRDLHMPIVKTYGTPALVIFDSNAWVRTVLYLLRWVILLISNAGPAPFLAKRATPGPE